MGGRSVHDDGHPYGQGRKDCPDCAAAEQVGRLARLATLAELLDEAYEYAVELDVAVWDLETLEGARSIVNVLRTYLAQQAAVS